MKSAKNDPKVKKTMVRNFEQKVKSSKVTCESRSQPLLTASEKSPKDVLLDEPSVCSSELFFNYITDVKNTSPPPITKEELKKSNINTRITKTLNFHLNNKIYKNLIDLNTSNENKLKKERTSSALFQSRIKRDLEPNIEDFYQETGHPDTPPNIPILRPKFKSVKPSENGHLHKLVASFENL